MPPRSKRQSGASDLASSTRPHRSAKVTPTKPQARSTTKSKQTTKSKPVPKSAPKASKSSKSSPYFNHKTKAKNVKAEDDDESSLSEAESKLSARSLSPTGLTETSDTSSDDGESEDAFKPTDDEEDEVIEISDDEELDGGLESDDLDATPKKEKYTPKRSNNKRKSSGGDELVADGGSATKKGRVVYTVVDDGDEENDSADIELEEGQTVVGRIHPAPKTGQVPPGRISRNTLNFLGNLQYQECNDRDWFKSHEPAFRQAEKEWQAFVGLIQDKFHEADDELPVLPPKDVIHRIYRDVRFSSDKTPYKTNFSFSTSRGGRKGIWAGYHLSISPRGRSILACGSWQPGKDELALMRANIIADPTRFRDTIEARDFVRLFGPAQPHKDGRRQNIFGHDDMLKVAPKGVDKSHKDIDLLKLRSVAVVHRFDDEQVLSSDFMDKVKDIVVVMAPFVHMLNDYITLPNNDDGNDEGAD